MSVALGLLLIAQLSSFEFSPIPSPQVAGGSFEITVIARDSTGGIYPYNSSVLLSTTVDDFWSYVYPNLVTFQNGVLQRNVMVSRAESLRLICTVGNISDTSDNIVVLNGSPARLLAVLPGERLAPGSPTGLRPDPPESQVAGDSFVFDVHVTDGWHNIVAGRTDSVYFAATDSFARLPGPATLANGSGTFAAGFRQAGTHRLAALPGSGSPVEADTSSTFSVIPGSYENILLLLPGETPLPGDTVRSGWQTPGKSGEAIEQVLRTPFDIQVYGTDACWNRVTGPADSVLLRSDFSFTSTPSISPFASGAVFSTQFNTSGPNQNIWAVLQNSGQESYRSQLTIRSRATMLEISAPDTVRAGETTFVHVTLRDDNGRPLVAAPCRFAVVAGNGDMLDSALLSDTLGRMTARFLCTRAFGDEHDTIRVTADTTGYAGIFVQMPDSSLLEGGIIVFPNPFGLNQDRCEINYYLQRSSPITVGIYDTFGNRVIGWQFRSGEEGALSGVNRIYWDGRNSKGRRVANGVYVIQVVGELHTGTTFRGTQRIGVTW